MNQYLEKISLTPVDCVYESFKDYSTSQNDFNPVDLNATNSDREDAVKTMYIFFNKMIEASNAYLICNVDYLVRKSTELNYANPKWIGSAQKRSDDSTFKLDHSN